MPSLSHPQVLEIPGARPGRETIWQMATGGLLEAARRSPYAVGLTRGPANRGRLIGSLQDCCPCGPAGSQNPLTGPNPQQLPGANQVQKPIQPAPQDPCSYFDEVLKGLGLSRELLCQCGKCGKGSGSMRSRSRSSAAAPRAPSPRTQKTRKPRQRRRVNAQGIEIIEMPKGRQTPVYKWYPKGANRSRSLCRDTANNLIVSKRFCGK